MEFQTVENFFQAMKAEKDDLTTRRRISIVPPNQAKKMGRRIKLRPDWEEIKLDVMEYALRYKFAPYTSGQTNCLRLVIQKSSSRITGMTDSGANAGAINAKVKVKTTWVVN